MISIKVNRFIDGGGLYNEAGHLIKHSMKTVDLENATAVDEEKEIYKCMYICSPVNFKQRIRVNAIPFIEHNKANDIEWKLKIKCLVHVYHVKENMLK